MNIYLSVIVGALLFLQPSHQTCSTPSNGASLTTNSGLNLEDVTCNSGYTRYPDTLDSFDNFGFTCTSNKWRPDYGDRTGSGDIANPCCLQDLTDCTFARMRHDADFFSYSASQSLPSSGQYISPETFYPTSPAAPSPCATHDFIFVKYKCMTGTTLVGTGKNEGSFYCYNGVYHEDDGTSMAASANALKCTI